MEQPTGFQIIDFIILVLYLAIVAIIGSFSGGKQRTTKDYFLGGSNIPWWAVAFAIVAAETSTLTFISIPGLAYITNLNFLQITFGYLIGRIIVSFLFIPAYKKGELSTAYTLLEGRFGRKTRSYASIVFLLTRLAADGVRLFATSIPLALIFKEFPFFAGFSNLQIYSLSIIIVTLVTLIYTYTGGVKGIIWVDVLQMGIYIGGAVIALIVLFNNVPGGLSSLSHYSDINKFSLINWGFEGGLKGFFSEPYTLVGSIIGGTFLSMASHGTDQLIVQRLLTTKTTKDSQKALITSGVIVIIQFALFLIVGLMLFAFYKGVNVGAENAPFVKSDEIFPYFIIHSLPTGLKGLIIAGLFAAAMSTLAGSISSISSSVMIDLYKPYFAKTTNEDRDLKVSRIFTIVCAGLLVFIAFLFIKVLSAVVEIALSIQSITYGGLLGTFLLGVLFKKPDQKAAIWGFSAGIIAMLSVILIPMIFGKPSIVYWTWYTLIGCLATLIVGNLITYVRKN
jgi:SSS family transporter